jgi:hypothetical protein
VSSKAELATVTITDVTGKLVSSQSIATNTIASILEAELESGLYFVSIATTSGERKVLRIVKQ